METLDPENGGTMVLRNVGKYLPLNISELLTSQQLILFVNRHETKPITSEWINPPTTPPEPSQKPNNLENDLRAFVGNRASINLARFSYLQTVY